jgi:2,4-dienoyl-CoA reductase-like NADH-dependent reductase (Old Yellow Enzyme family)
MANPSLLFSPIRIGSLELRNRIARSATAESLADRDGVPGDRVAEIYRKLAAGGVGLIITGHAFVHAGGRCHAQMTGVHEDGLVPALARLAHAAHEGGAKIALQINHGGRACDPAAVPELVGPSAVAAAPQRPAPRALSLDEIAEVIGAFGRAAVRAKTAGFDAVQIHAAHGYLASQFLSPLANRRTDRYGGSLENRARLLAEIAVGIRRGVGPDFPLLVKLGVTDNEDGGLTVEEGAEVASWLPGFGIDAVETSTGAKGSIQTRITRESREAYLLPLARAVHARSAIPILLVGGLRSRAVMERVLAEGIEMVSLSRPLIREPDLPRKLAAEAEARAECISCNRCWPRGPDEGIACKRDEARAAS